jgi:16S rRNA (uracil1498-N3)-methyltransferase
MFAGMPYFFASAVEGRVTIVGDDARHLARSLRARVGEEIEVVDPVGMMLTVRLETVSADRVSGVVVSSVAHQPEPDARVTIGIANLPASSLELVWSRCTEAGALAFVVVQAERSVARGARASRWETIVREAAMLAGRLVVPSVAGPLSLREAIESSPSPLMLVRGATLLLPVASGGSVTLLVGPEGGWTEGELSLVRDHAGLGPRNLRADTAALVGLATALARRP